MNITVNPHLPTLPPGGFYVPTYLTAVKRAFQEKYQVGEEPNHVFKDIDYTESFDFEHIDLELPAVILDMEGAKLNPPPGEHEHEQSSPYSNLGQLSLYVGMRAVIIVNNRSEIPISNGQSIDAQAGVRHLAFDVGGFVTRKSRFGEPCGMAQISHIQPLQMTEERTTTLIAWEVRWQHSVSFGEQETPAQEYPAIDAADVTRVMAGETPYDQNPVIEKESGRTDDPDTDIDESKFDTKVGYIEIYRKPAESD